MLTDHGRSVPVLVPALRCATRVVALLARRSLHLTRRHVGAAAYLPDGRKYLVFRETSCGTGDLDDTVTLAVWFHLRGVPAGARIRRFLFERESILNTILYAGFEGYRVKLWMVDPVSSDYAGLYAWHGADAARRYARYITSVLRPLSVRGSVGYEMLASTPLDRFLESTDAALRLGRAGDE